MSGLIQRESRENALPETANRPALSVQGLSTSFTKQGRDLKAVNNVSFDLAPGEILGLVGESGSGKSITLRSLIGIVRPQGRIDGSVLWKGRNLVTMNEPQLRKIRGREIAMIFQEPMSSLNPLLTIGLQITENLKAHTSLGRQERQKRAIELLDLVGIPAAASRLDDYPHQFSGGMRQRVMIAIALASNPELLLADEPTTALDVTIQDQILRLIMDLRTELNMAVILVTHDLGVVAQSCDRVAVMYAGRIIESGSVGTILKAPQHPYTLGLLQSVPQDQPPRTPLFSIDGTPPALDDMPTGCAFAPRCQQAQGTCLESAPDFSLVGSGHAAACHILETARPSLGENK
ncbi:ABC transporter ATP-binding protein [Aestuariispira insulae]|uniref:Oligopeptide transport system ATP-binding protein n=1 Tax=Aestuariispira insulae TaxID=1461337 RepID=A0A3D9HUJ3_9PROT|nr:ABC transporter ATP-binding protein [Aestuariispira insulae]RED52556.1 oligopeptide transport system ATP-binding protein [Aestuariispira insulae]